MCHCNQQILGIYILTKIHSFSVSLCIVYRMIDSGTKIYVVVFGKNYIFKTVIESKWEIMCFKFRVMLYYRIRKCIGEIMRGEKATRHQWEALHSFKSLLQSLLVVVVPRQRIVGWGTEWTNINGRVWKKTVTCFIKYVSKREWRNSNCCRASNMCVPLSVWMLKSLTI